MANVEEVLFEVHQNFSSLSEKYLLRLCYCAVPINTFMGKIKNHQGNLWRRLHLLETRFFWSVTPNLTEPFCRFGNGISRSGWRQTKLNFCRLGHFIFQRVVNIVIRHFIFQRVVNILIFQRVVNIVIRYFFFQRVVNILIRHFVFQRVVNIVIRHFIFQSVVNIAFPRSGWRQTRCKYSNDQLCKTKLVHPQEPQWTFFCHSGVKYSFTRNAIKWKLTIIF